MSSRECEKRMELVRAESLNQAVAEIFGAQVRIDGQRPVYGGDINESRRLELSDGSSLFMKSNRITNLGFFEEEAKGLSALRQTGTIGVPQVLGIGTIENLGKSFLMLEYLEAAPRVSGYWEIFGRELAAMHRADSAPFAAADRGLPFGFEMDNYIGATPQFNSPRAGWIEFFRDCRLAPQMKRADRYMNGRMRKQCEWLLGHLGSYLVEPEFPSLIHGDLWSGNAVCGPDGKAWILDPAAYVGHFEAELAMTELFGGFAPAFYESYRENNPIDSGYRDRKDLYNLYHMLNHLNLFGVSYLGSVQRILTKYVG